MDVRICKCGHIHFIPDTVIDGAITENKNLLLICGSCGTATVIGADKHADWDDPSKTVYDMYAYEMVDKTKSWTAEDFVAGDRKKAFSQVYYSKGTQVMMNTGMNATNYDFGRFADTWYPDFWKIQRADITAQEIMEFINQWEKDRVTVNMGMLLQMLSDEEAEALSHYRIEGMDWTDTKYKTQYN